MPEYNCELLYFFYMIAPCADGYRAYDFMLHQICLKYVPVHSTYSSAKLSCDAEGGDLIKIASQKKFDIFKRHHGMSSLNLIFSV